MRQLSPEDKLVRRILAENGGFSDRLRHAFLRQPQGQNQSLIDIALTIGEITLEQANWIKSQIHVSGLPTPGQFIGEFKVVSKLGQGGMGAVFHAIHSGRDVALKIVTAQQTPETLIRFENEAKALARVDQHPHIVKVHSFGRTPANQPFMVLDFIAGRGFDDLISDDQYRDPGFTLETILRPLASALDFIHEQGILHRDLKPANVLVRDEDNHLYLSDFGLAKEQGSEGLTRTGEVVGTPAYMAPEQLQGQELSPATDVWAFGVLAYECLTGQRPFAGQSNIEIFSAVTKAKFKKLSDCRPDLQEKLDAVFNRCFSLVPAERYSTATEFVDGFEAALAGPKPVFTKSRVILLVAGLFSVLVTFVGARYLLAEKTLRINSSMQMERIDRAYAQVIERLLQDKRIGRPRSDFLKLSASTAEFESGVSIVSELRETILKPQKSARETRESLKSQILAFDGRRLTTSKLAKIELIRSRLALIDDLQGGDLVQARARFEKNGVVKHDHLTRALLRSLLRSIEVEKKLDSVLLSFQLISDYEAKSGVSIDTMSALAFLTEAELTGQERAQDKRFTVRGLTEIMDRAEQRLPAKLAMRFKTELLSVNKIDPAKFLRLSTLLKKCENRVIDYSAYNDLVTFVSQVRSTGELDAVAVEVSRKAISASLLTSLATERGVVGVGESRTKKLDLDRTTFGRWVTELEIGVPYDTIAVLDRCSQESVDRIRAVIINDISNFIAKAKSRGDLREAGSFESNDDIENAATTAVRNRRLSTRLGRLIASVRLLARDQRLGFGSLFSVLDQLRVAEGKSAEEVRSSALKRVKLANSMSEILRYKSRLRLSPWSESDTLAVQLQLSYAKLLLRGIVRLCESAPHNQAPPPTKASCQGTGFQAISEELSQPKDASEFQRQLESLIADKNYQIRSLFAILHEISHAQLSVPELVRFATLLTGRKISEKTLSSELIKFCEQLCEQLKLPMPAITTDNTLTLRVLVQLALTLKYFEQYRIFVGYRNGVVREVAAEHTHLVQGDYSEDLEYLFRVRLESMVDQGLKDQCYVCAEILREMCQDFRETFHQTRLLIRVLLLKFLARQSTESKVKLVKAYENYPFLNDSSVDELGDVRGHNGHLFVFFTELDKRADFKTIVQVCESLNSGLAGAESRFAKFRGDNVNRKKNRPLVERYESVWRFYVKSLYHVDRGRLEKHLQDKELNDSRREEALKIVASLKSQ